MSRVPGPLAGAFLAAVALVVTPSLAAAHTDTDLVAVPARQEATVSLKPTHGCGDSPTVEVAIQVPVPGAVPVQVEGWIATATPEEGRTVLEWKGGSLPTDQEGAFPATFTAPDTVGELLLFPSVQVCENGEELAWIAGDPASEYPAPRLLVLPPDFEPAATIDDVPPDAPGREQLTAIVDVDNPTGSTAPPTTERSTTTTERPKSTTTSERPDAPDTSEAPQDDAADADDEGGDTVIWVVAAVAVAVIIGLIAKRLLRGRG